LKVWVGIIFCCWIYYKAGQPIPLILIFIGNAVFSIFNTIKVMSGEPYNHFPFFKEKVAKDKTK
jgi:hypothetical protein